MRLVVARVGRAHGLRGEVTVELRTDSPAERFVPGARLYADALPASRQGSLVVATVRDHNGVLLLGFEGVGDRSAAEALRGTVLQADVPDESGEDEAWYDHQLVGLAVLDPAGEQLGEVVAVEHPPAQDLLVIRRPDGVRRWVPFVTALVPHVDPSAGHLVVVDPGGLIED